MKLSFRSKYRSSGKNNPSTKGQPRWSYAVSGTAEEIADFKKSQKGFYVEDKGTPIFNSPRDLGNSTALIKRQSDGRWVPTADEREVSIGRLAELASKFPMFANQFGAEAAGIATRKESVTQSVSAPVAVAETADLGK